MSLPTEEVTLPEVDLTFNPVDAGLHDPPHEGEFYDYGPEHPMPGLVEPAEVA